MPLSHFTISLDTYKNFIQGFLAFSSRDVDRLGRHIEALLSNPVTKTVLESPPVDCSGRTLNSAMSQNNNRGRGGGRGRGRGRSFGRGGQRNFYNRGNQYGYNRRGRGRGRGQNGGWRRNNFDQRNFSNNQGYDSYYQPNSNANSGLNSNQTDNSKLDLNIDPLHSKSFQKILKPHLASVWCHHHGHQHSWNDCSLNPKSANYNPQSAQRVAADRGGFNGGRGQRRTRR